MWEPWLLSATPMSAECLSCRWHCCGRQPAQAAVSRAPRTPRSMPRWSQRLVLASSRCCSHGRGCCSRRWAQQFLSHQAGRARTLCRLSAPLRLWVGSTSAVMAEKADIRLASWSGTTTIGCREHAHRAAAPGSRIRLLKSPNLTLKEAVGQLASAIARGSSCMRAFCTNMLRQRTFSRMPLIQTLEDDQVSIHADLQMA